MKPIYYPGCTLHEKAKELDDGARKAAAALKIEFTELPIWTCCGAAYPLSDDTVMGMVAAARILSNARKHGDTLVTLCSFCYNVLKRVNNTIKTNPEKRAKLNTFLDNGETPEGIYSGQVRVLHYIEMLKEYGFEKVRKTIKKPIGMKIAPYYGCQLLRPEKEMHFDTADRPIIFENFITAMGGTPIDFPFKTECCGSYHTLSSPDTARKCSFAILDSAVKNGADAIAMTCPLCYFNLETEQEKITAQHSSLKPIPVFYFTELLCLALDIKCDMTRHTVDIGDVVCKYAGVKA